MTADTSTALLPPRGAARNAALAFFLLAPLAYAVLGVCLGQDTGYDFRQYHWYNAYAFVTGRHASGIDFIPAGVQSFYNPLIDVPFYLLATAAGPKAAMFVMGAVQGLNACLLFCLSWMLLPAARVAEKTALAIFAALAGMTGAMVIAEAGACFGDNIVSLFILSSLLLLLRHAPSSGAWPWRRLCTFLFLAGLPAGLVMGLKLTAGFFCVALCAALLLATGDIKRNIVMAFFFGLGVLAGLAATYGFWGLYLYRHYGSPVFPYLNGIFQSPFFAPGGLHEKSFFYDGNLLWYPFAFTFGNHAKVATESAWRDFRFLALYVFMALAAMRLYAGSFCREKAGAAKPPPDTAAAPRRMVFATVIVSYIIWMMMFRIYRYLMPLEMLSPLLVMICLHALLPRHRRLKTALGAAVLCFLLATIQVPPYGRKKEWTPVTDLTAFELPRAGNLMILMAGREAYAHTLPAFPASAAAVRIDGTLFAADESEDDNLLKVRKLIRKRIDAHHGPFLWFAPEQERDARAAVLKTFDLAVSGPCQAVTDKMAKSARSTNFVFMPRNYDLCPVKKTKADKR
ncbi:MAG: hypothetical protein GC185_04705 [Alphaproteobacteria bacterium]|nr:hypothetical protein [Alphaproteobacteria bacterium]